MNFTIFNIFPVPVVLGDFENFSNTKDTLVPLFKEYEKNNPCENYCYGGYTSYGNNENILFWKECSELLDFIGISVANFHAHNGLAGNVVLQDSWFSINRKYAFHGKHNHLPCTWSGVYYVQCDEQDSEITFINKNLDNAWPYCNRIEANELNSTVFRLQPKTGSLIIFPSYLDHEVEQQTSDNERITIAFNFTVQDDYS